VFKYVNLTDNSVAWAKKRFDVDGWFCFEWVKESELAAAKELFDTLPKIDKKGRVTV
jgi:hypothetical protein